MRWLLAGLAVVVAVAFVRMVILSYGWFLLAVGRATRLVEPCLGQHDLRGDEFGGLEPLVPAEDSRFM